MQGSRGVVSSVWVVGLIGSVLFVASCGGGGGTSSTTPATVGSPAAGGSTVATIVNFADSPSDRVVAFELTIASATLTRADGSVLTVLSTPRRVEVTHVSGSAEPLALPWIPQGTYTQASIVVSAPDVVYIDNSGNKVEKRDSAATKTWNLAFNPPLQVGATPVVFTMDVNVRASLTIDPVTGAVSFNPVATMTSANVAQLQNQQEVESGELSHIIGRVTANTSNSFTITTGAGATSISFSTDSATAFENASSPTDLVLNAVVRVEGTTQQDGTLLAKEVELLSANGTEADGIVTSATGNPATSFDMVLQNGDGGGLDPTSFGSTMTVSISNKSKFKVDQGKIDLSGLSLPTFSMTNLSKGQRVEVESDNTPANGTMTADTVKLQQQALVGSISAITSSQFTLTIADDAALKLLTGKSTLNVYMQRNTELMNGAAVTQGAIVKVRGLLFFDSAQGAFVIVADRVTTP